MGQIQAPLEGQALEVNVYVIGSCRVHGPLRTQPGYQPVVPGYTHTAREALQRLAFVRGQAGIPASVAPYVFARRQAPAINARQRRAIRSADVVVVELCSAKAAAIRGYPVNINYAQTRGAVPDIHDATATLEADLKLLLESVPRLIVAQHVELGIPARAQYAARLREVCGDLNVPVFDPAVADPVMIDPYHYDKASIRRVGAALMEVCHGRA